MEPLDGNAIAGALHDYFGEEMTAAAGACTHCGTRSLIAELAVYGRAPGTVVRCRACGKVVMVVLEVRGRVTVDHRHFTLA
jgi:uncharacterized Zn finger protein